MLPDRSRIDWNDERLSISGAAVGYAKISALFFCKNAPIGVRQDRCRTSQRANRVAAEPPTSWPTINSGTL